MVETANLGILCNRVGLQYGQRIKQCNKFHSEIVSIEIIQSGLINSSDIACVTETWLRDHIHDNVVCIPGYNLVRRDRIDVTRGGVCTYIKKGLKYTVLEDLHDDKIEAIWLQLRPSRLPRGLSCIIIANVYHPQTDRRF